MIVGRWYVQLAALLTLMFAIVHLCKVFKIIFYCFGPFLFSVQSVIDKLDGMVDDTSMS